MHEEAFRRRKGVGVGESHPLPHHGHVRISVLVHLRLWETQTRKNGAGDVDTVRSGPRVSRTSSLGRGDPSRGLLLSPHLYGPCPGPSDPLDCRDLLCGGPRLWSRDRRGRRPPEVDAFVYWWYVAKLVEFFLFEFSEFLRTSTRPG